MARILTSSPADVSRFIEKMYKSDGNYSVGELVKAFDKTFGKVEEKEADRIIEAGYEEAQRGRRAADSIQMKYDRPYPGKGRRMMVELAEGNQEGAFSAKQAAEDVNRYIEAMSRYNSINKLMGLVWKFTRSKS